MVSVVCYTMITPPISYCVVHFLMGSLERLDHLNAYAPDDIRHVCSAFGIGFRCWEYLFNMYGDTKFYCLSNDELIAIERAPYGNSDKEDSQSWAWSSCSSLGRLNVMDEITQQEEPQFKCCSRPGTEQVRTESKSSHFTMKSLLESFEVGPDVHYMPDTGTCNE